MWPATSPAKFRRQRTSRLNSVLSAPAVECMEQRVLLSASTVQLFASHDNTIYDVTTGDQSNGSGEFIVVGGAAGTAVARRGLLSFDIASANIPDGSTVLDVVLSMNLAQSIGGPATVGVHRLLKAWGEAGSNPSADEIEGAPAQPLDATWLFSRFDSAAWGNPGGDFAGSSAAAPMTSPGVYEWVGGGLIADVQDWLEHPDSNFGWLLKGTEAAGNIQLFNSRDGLGSVYHPTLEITYEPPVLPGLVEGRGWHDPNVDGVPQTAGILGLNLQFFQGNTYQNVFGGNEYWYRSGLNNAWYFLTPIGVLTQWNGTPGQLTGTVIEHLGIRAWNLPQALIDTPEAAPESWLNGLTYQLVNAAGVVMATTTSRPIDLNVDGIIDEETEQGWYRFEGIQPGNYTVRQAPMNGWLQNATPYSAGAEAAHELNVTLGLSTTGNLYENFGGLGERWLKGTTGWYYITPTGELFRWNGQAISSAKPLSGTLISTPGMSYYRNVSLLYDAANPVLSVQSGGTISEVNFSNYKPAVIDGQTWVDANPDGVRNISGLPDLQAIATPNVLSLASLSQNWYAIPTAGSPDPLTGFGDPRIQSYFYTSTTGQVYQWSPVTGTTLLTSISAISGLTAAEVVQQAFQAEPFESGSTLQLLDENGYVVATTISADRDVNGDSLINPEEHGWYEFSNLLPGRYSVRTISPAGTISVSHGDTTLQLTAAGLKQQFGFKAGTQDHFDFGDRHERWFQGRSNQWFFITPNGAIFEWNRISGGTHGAANGTKVGQLSSSFYLNLNLLFQPKSSVLTVQSQQHSSLNLGSMKVVDSLFASLAGELV